VNTQDPQMPISALKPAQAEQPDLSGCANSAVDSANQIVAKAATR
jgi:hypothetical protein